MSKRDQDFLRATDGHIRTYSTLPPEDTEALLALAWRGARGSEQKKLKAEIERLQTALNRLADEPFSDLISMRAFVCSVLRRGGNG